MNEGKPSSKKTKIVALSKQITASIENAVNHDIYVSDATLKPFENLAHLFRLPKFLYMFNEYDKKAKDAKKRYQNIGALVLITGFCSLTGVVWEVLSSGLHWHIATTQVVAIETLAVICFVIWLFDRFILRSKPKYLTNCFARERLRHWFYQLFLNGALICEADQKKQLLLIEQSLDEFTQKHRDVVGAMNVFVGRPASRKRLLHEISTYSNTEVAKQSFEALELLRFEHQSQFARGKTTELVSASGVSMTESYHWSETLARLSLFAAVAIPIVQLLLIGVSANYPMPFVEKAHVCLSAAALFFVIVSASARAEILRFPAVLR